MRAMLDDLSFGFTSELAFIRDAVGEGFEAAAMVDSEVSARLMIEAGARTLILPQGADEASNWLENVAREHEVKFARLGR
jgi:predicted TIM-barrel enzyme